MKTLSTYRFRNDKAIEVVYLNPSDQKRKGVPECDNLGLAFESPEGRTVFYLRPDEAVIVINLLSDALFKAVRSYEIGLLRGYNGFKR
jgi:hypothetical protein